MNYPSGYYHQSIQLTEKISQREIPDSFSSKPQAALKPHGSHGPSGQHAIHSLHLQYDKPQNKAVLLIDAKNAFNCLNRNLAVKKS